MRAGEYLVAEPLDYFHFAEAPDWVYGLVLQPDPETRPAASVREIDVAHPSERKGSGFELEVVMSPAKPATDPDSAIFTASMA